MNTFELTICGGLDGYKAIEIIFYEDTKRLWSRFNRVLHSSEGTQQGASGGILKFVINFFPLAVQLLQSTRTEGSRYIISGAYVGVKVPIL